MLSADEQRPRSRIEEYNMHLKKTGVSPLCTIRDLKFIHFSSCEQTVSDQISIYTPSINYANKFYPLKYIQDFGHNIKRLAGRVQIARHQQLIRVSGTTPRSNMAVNIVCCWHLSLRQRDITTSVESKNKNEIFLWRIHSVLLSCTVSLFLIIFYIDSNWHTASFQYYSFEGLHTFEQWKLTLRYTECAVHVWSPARNRWCICARALEALNLLLPA